MIIIVILTILITIIIMTMIIIMTIIMMEGRQDMEMKEMQEERMIM